MDTLLVNLGERSYPIRIGRDWLDRLGQALGERTAAGGRVLVVTDSRVGPLYGGRALAALASNGFSVEQLTIAEGETAKTLATCGEIYTFLLSKSYGRDTVLVALGGGVVGDIVGFAAATYMRGVAFVQAPTTLLAMVDSSVGGKTGVNHPLGKNMIGAFHQPILVFIDLGTLATLAPEEFRAGFVEVVKYGVIRDAALFAFCEEQREAIFSLDAAALEHIVRTSCAIKADVVAADERETGLRAILNFGHTIGHAIESLTAYAVYKHGEAVAIGMVAAGRLAVRLGRFEVAAQQRLERLLESAGLPVRIPKQLDTEAIVARLAKDKKARGGKVRFVLPETIGRVVVEGDIPEAVVREVIESMRK